MFKMHAFGTWNKNFYKHTHIPGPMEPLCSQIFYHYPPSSLTLLKLNL